MKSIKTLFVVAILGVVASVQTQAAWLISGFEPTVKIGPNQYMLWAGTEPFIGPIVQVLKRSSNSCSDGDWSSIGQVDPTWQPPATDAAWSQWAVSALNSAQTIINADAQLTGNADVRPANLNDLQAAIAKHVALTAGTNSVTVTAK